MKKYKLLVVLNLVLISALLIGGGMYFYREYQMGKFSKDARPLTVQLRNANGVDKQKFAEQIVIIGKQEKFVSINKTQAQYYGGVLSGWEECFWIEMGMIYNLQRGDTEAAMDFWAAAFAYGCYN